MHLLRDLAELRGHGLSELAELRAHGLRLRSQSLHFLAERGELRVLTAAGEGARAPRRECGGRGDNKDGGKVHEVTLARPGI